MSDRFWGQRRSWVLDTELYVSFVCQYESRVQKGNSSEKGGVKPEEGKHSRPQAGAPRIQSRDFFRTGNSFCRQPSGLLRVS